AWRRQRREQALLDRWRYRITWKPLPDRPAVLSGTWLVLTPAEHEERDWVDGCVQALVEHGATVDVITLPAGETDPAAIADHLYTHTTTDSGTTTDSTGTGTAGVGAGGVGGVLSLLALR